MVSIKPIKIPGRWKEGFALDYHTISSEYLGDDEFGHPIYDTKRTEIGELLYRLKYKSDNSVISEMVDILEGFLNSWKPPIEFIIPVPPTRMDRILQPVFVLAEELSKRINIPIIPQAIYRVRQIPELKRVYDFDERLRLLEGAFKVDSS
jgi:predicted amidophosphoribosyltransferase